MTAISKREFFAATALEGLLAAPIGESEDNPTVPLLCFLGGRIVLNFQQEVVRDFAKLAYQFADAMLERSAK